jgi:hypothetical protein
MGFTTPCFIRKNTPELRSKLKELGYDICCCTEFKDACWLNTFLLDKEHSVHGVGYLDEEEPLTLEQRLQCFLADNARSEHPNIDCGTNEELFLALAALRDDSDYMQWFVCPKTHIKRLPGCFGQIVGMDGHYQEIVGYEWYRYENKDNALNERVNATIQMDVKDMEFLPHKATVEEIIEHFKR